MVQAQLNLTSELWLYHLRCDHTQTVSVSELGSVSLEMPLFLFE